MGPAPVALADYVAQVQHQRLGDADLTRQHVERGLQNLVLSATSVRRIGRAVTSRRPALIYGASGNGKTTLLHALASMLGGPSSCRIQSRCWAKWSVSSMRQSTSA